MEWVEATGSTVEIAVEAAITELGLDTPEQAQVEVIQEPKVGFLGVGARPAIVKVSRKPRRKSRRTRRKPKAQEPAATSRKTRKDKGSRGTNGARPAEKKGGSTKERRAMNDDQTTSEEKTEKPDLSIEDQAAVAREFLSGLLDAFGLEGEVQTRIDDDILYLDVVGEQTEALVGPKGSTMQSVLELTRTTVQRRTYGAPRMRIDIAGYGSRRREALTIYTGKLVDQVKAGGGEIMLEPMNAADRKVVHDAAAAFGGVRTYSEGEDPRRAVVIAATEEIDDD